MTASSLPCATDSSGNYVFSNPVTPDEIIQLATSILEARLLHGEPVYIDYNTVRKYLKVRLGGLEREIFGCLYLNSKLRVIGFEELFQGTINKADIYPREVVKSALRHNAAFVVFAHNHPSGIPELTEADMHVTQRLKAALATVDISVLDHIVVGGTMTVSLAALDEEPTKKQTAWQGRIPPLRSWEDLQ